MRPDGAARAAIAAPPPRVAGRGARAAGRGARLRAAIVLAPLQAAIVAAALLAVPAGAARLDAAAGPQEQVERGLLCHCGCSGLTVHSCTCGTAAAIRQEIASRLSAGETAEQVIADYVARYGEKIRPAPTKEGFNLLAWITPFAALFAAGVAVVLLVRRWEARGSLPPPDAPGESAAGAGAPEPLGARERRTLERIERELRERR
jgi:cytochrome c-type biogenesis protein CcmH